MKLKKFCTLIRAIDPLDGEMKLWAGLEVEATDIYSAQMYCQHNRLGYCEVVGEYLGDEYYPMVDEMGLN